MDATWLAHLRSMSARVPGLAYVAIAVVLFSTSPVLVRWCAPFSASEITFGRMAIAALTLGMALAVSRPRLRLSRSDSPRFLLYGLVTAAHFFLYVAAVGLTTIAHALTLTYTAPIFVAAFSRLFLRERLNARQYAGLLLAVCGIAILTGFEPTWTAAMIVGDLLAVGAAIAFGIYSVIGRARRSDYGLLPYAFGLYSFAAVWLAAPAVVTWLSRPEPIGFGWTQIASVVALGIVPLAIGHTLYNASLRRTHAARVNVVASQEVTGGVILGAIFLGEVPAPTTVVGAAITLMGTLLVVRTAWSASNGGPAAGT